MRNLRLTTFLTPVAIVLANAPANAATTVSTATTTPLQTSVAGDVTVASGGTVTVTGVPAVTVDSSNAMTVASGGSLVASNANNSGGILVNAGTNSAIANAGTITALENYTVAPVTGTSTASGPIANTTGRYGILVAGPAAGSIANTGTIKVKGLGAAGIQVIGTYNGSISNTGTITAIGDGSTGISVQAVNGSLTAGGPITVVGAGAQALLAAGDISGALTIQGALGQQSSYTTDSGTSQTLSASALRTGAAAIEIDGNVAGGVLVYAPCTAVTVSSVASCTSSNTVTTAGSIVSVGNSPALQIGGANPIVIAAAAPSIDGHTYSLAIDGTVGATASFATTDAFGVVIGGRGGTVALPGGIGISGTVSADANDATATAILISPGATVATLTNSGSIRASLSQAGGTAAYGIRDLSGTLTSVTNNGNISATAGLASAAIDLSANTSGVTVTQSLNPYEVAQQTQEQAATTYSAAAAKIYASITGDILTGSGNDLIAIQTGTVTGNGWLGGGADQVQLSGDGRWVGDLHFGTGTAAISLAGTSAFTGGLYLASMPTTLTIGGTSKFAGTGIVGGSQLDVTVNGGSFGAAQGATIAVRSLTVNAGGTLTAVIDGAAGTSSLIQAGTATFASGANVAATISSLTNAQGTYQILSAGTLVGNPTFSTATTQLPVLFKGSVATQGNSLYLTIARKTATDLGLTSAQASGYDAIYANAVANAALANSLLQVSSVSALQSQMNTLLPDHAGGTFDFVTRGSRLASRHLTDNTSIYDISDVGGWLEPIYFKGSKDATGTAPWTDDGFGLSFGLERKLGAGRIGVSFAWLSGHVDDGSWQSIKASSYELGAFWRISRGPFYAFAKVSADRVSFDSVRTFTGAVNSTALTYATDGHWAGLALTGTGGASYKLALPGHFSLKPMVVLDYTRLHENGYSEAGATAATPIDLAVQSRNSTSLAATTTVTASWSMGDQTPDERPLTLELEGGRRNQLSGNLGTTTAAFTGGNAFSIVPDALKSGWVGEARVLAGGYDFTWQLSGRAEQLAGKKDLSARVSLSIAM